MYHRYNRRNVAGGADSAASSDIEEEVNAPTVEEEEDPHQYSEDEIEEEPSGDFGPPSNRPVGAVVTSSDARRVRVEIVRTDNDADEGSNPSDEDDDDQSTASEGNSSNESPYPDPYQYGFGDGIARYQQQMREQHHAMQNLQQRGFNPQDPYVVMQHHQQQQIQLQQMLLRQQQQQRLAEQQQQQHRVQTYQTTFEVPANVPPLPAWPHGVIADGNGTLLDSLDAGSGQGSGRNGQLVEATDYQEADEAQPRGNGDGQDAEQEDAGMMADDGEDYEPTEQEVKEYCEWLGLNTTTERQLIWIAREALKAPLPENWRICYTEEGEIYYFNGRTGESIWDHPMDAYYKALFRQEKARLDQKKKHMRLFEGSLEIKPLADFFSDAADEVDGEDDDAPWLQVPETLIDAIDFRIYVQPVVLPTSGRTVSRHTIINNKWRDPFSREYVENRRLVPNVDKRTEVDSWLTKMTMLYLEKVSVSPEGVQRLVKIIPYLLDKEEEVCVRAQQRLLSWIKKNIDLNSKRRASVASSATFQQTSTVVETSDSESSRRNSPRKPQTSGGASENTGTLPRLNNSTSHAASVSKSQNFNGTQSRKTSARKSVQASKTPKGNSKVETKVPPVAVEAPPPPPTLLELFASLDKEKAGVVLGSLLTMSSSSSREMLLMLVVGVKSFATHDAFYGFNDEVLNVLHLSPLDLSRMAATLIAGPSASGPDVKAQSFRISNEDHVVALRWIVALFESTANVNALAKLDFVAAEHLVLVLFNMKDSIQTTPDTLIAMLQGTEGWPAKLMACPDDHVTLLLDMGLAAESPQAKVAFLYELCLNSGERCMVHLEPSKEQLAKAILLTSALSQCDHTFSSINADRLAAVLVFHSIIAVTDIDADSGLVLRVALQLIPRLTRSQWRPRHFHDTVSALIDVIEANAVLAGTVLGSQCVLTLTKELAKKKNISDDIRSKLEAVEASERQLQQSSALNNWTLLAAKLRSGNDDPVSIGPFTPERNEAPHNPRSEVLNKARNETNESSEKTPVKKQPPSATKLPSLSPPKRQQTVPQIGRSPVKAEGPAIPSSSDVPQPLGLHTRSTGERRGTPDTPTGTLSMSQWVSKAGNKKDDLRRQRAANIVTALTTLMAMRLKPKAQPPPPRTKQGSGSLKSVSTPGRGERRSTPSAPPPPVATAANTSLNTSSGSVNLPPIVN